MSSSRCLVSGEAGYLFKDGELVVWVEPDGSGWHSGDRLSRLVVSEDVVPLSLGRPRDEGLIVRRVGELGMIGSAARFLVE